MSSSPSEVATCKNEGLPQTQRTGGARWFTLVLDTELFPNSLPRRWFGEEERNEKKTPPLLSPLGLVTVSFSLISISSPAWSPRRLSTGRDRVHASEKLYGFRFFDAARSRILDAWMERFGALDAAKAILPDAGRLVEHAKMRQSEAAAA
ncbi:uncharacterized protein LOC133904026 [Phragmites australis]|uniref:uncharacterized protein LOC133904026 n=1 Tax=Phragmites australis TaxID=29695 RepID=UPI002D77DFB3|nr:uncharacterized protein LOC133904026 [Phragmites australis]